MTALLILAITAAAIAITIHIRRRQKKLRNRKIRRYRDIWTIGIYSGPTPFKLAPPQSIKNPILAPEQVTDIKARFVADPFMFTHKGVHYLFLEVLNDERNKGEIGYATSTDLKQWTYKGIVLKERFHLSYPYVFEYNGEQYMLPEGAKSRKVTLYKAERFPDIWKKHATLLGSFSRKGPLGDPSIILHNSHWYLFTYAGKTRSLHLYTSPELTGSWSEHPASPILTDDIAFARPGGRVIAYKGNIYRYAQDGKGGYGKRVWAFRITTLTPTEYREELLEGGPVIEGGHEQWSNAGMHTVDPHLAPDGTWLAFVDGLENREKTA